jgi:hypothetical protein
MPAAKKKPLPSKSLARAFAKPPVRKAVPARAPAPVAPVIVKPVAKPVESVKADKIDKTDKSKKLKLVRDSFTIPKAEYTVIEELKQRAAKAGRPAKKSEVLRAGVKALAAMSDVAFMAALGAVPTVKTGRPAKT